MRIPKPIAQVAQFVSRQFRLFNHRYTTIAILCSVVMLIAIDVLRHTNDLQAQHWPIMAAFGVAPFITVWAVVQLIRSFALASTSKPTPSAANEFHLLPSRRLEDQIESMKSIIDCQVSLAASKAKRFELLGQLATVFSIGMPLSTWVYAFFQVNAKTKLEHLWPFIFSSTSFGFIAITVAVTFLRHSKSHLTDLHKLRAYSDSLHKVRVALSTESPKEASITLDLLAKHAKFRGGVPGEESQPQSSEEMKNAFSLVSTLLSKS